MQTHLKKIKTAPIALHSYTCQIVGCNYETKCSRKMLSHLNFLHEKDKNFTSPCLYTTRCFHKENFRTCSGLNLHLRRFHPTFFSAIGTKGKSNVAHNQQGIETISGPHTVEDNAIAMFGNYYLIFKCVFCFCLPDIFSVLL